MSSICNRTNTSQRHHSVLSHHDITLSSIRDLTVISQHDITLSSICNRTNTSQRHHSVISYHDITVSSIRNITVISHCDITVCSIHNLTVISHYHSDVTLKSKLGHKDICVYFTIYFTISSIDIEVFLHVGPMIIILCKVLITSP